MSSSALFDFLEKMRRLHAIQDICERRHIETGVGPNVRNIRLIQKTNWLARLKWMLEQENEEDDVVLMLYLHDVAKTMMGENR